MAATRKVSFGPNPEKVQTEYEAMCKDCGPEAMVIEDHQSGDLICQRCGIVVGERIIDTDREWREFESDSGSQQRSRVGAAGDILLEDAGLTTSIGGTDAISKSLARTQMRGQKSEQKSIIEGFKRIEEFAGKMELPERQKFRAKELFKQMEEHKATRGRNSEALIAAVIYMACRLENVPRTLKEFVVITGVQKKDIGKAYKHILSVLKVNMTHVSADDYMTRFCNHLDLPVSVRNAAEQVAKKASEMGIVAGKTPTTIAAAAIFLVSQLTENDKKAQKDIFEATGVSEATIRNCYKDMEPHRKELLGTYVKQFPVN